MVFLRVRTQRRLQRVRQVPGNTTSPTATIRSARRARRGPPQPAAAPARTSRRWPEGPVCDRATPPHCAAGHGARPGGTERRPALLTFPFRIRVPVRTRGPAALAMRMSQSGNGLHGTVTHPRAAWPAATDNHAARQPPGWRQRRSVLAVGRGLAASSTAGVSSLHGHHRRLGTALTLMTDGH